jgi:hypothetical protein
MVRFCFIMALGGSSKVNFCYGLFKLLFFIPERDSNMRDID